jgi:hypothetical protein
MVLQFRHYPSGVLWLCPKRARLGAFITSAALLLGEAVHHALYLRNQSPCYAQINVFEDRLLNYAARAARTQSHDFIAEFLADLAR